jgi:hypothetical protein
MVADELIRFYHQLIPPSLPSSFEILHPQQDKEVMKIVKLFFNRFYKDNNQRRLILGINPGRFGAGITGVNFTAPRQLKEQCGIDHHWGNSSELSAEFIYEMIRQYGGVSRFYSDYFISSVSPLGFIKDGRNINYYDDKDLQEAVKPFILLTIRQQIEIGFDRNVCFCIGGEKNFKFLSGINGQHSFFKRIIPLPHPRFIMQYRRKHLQQFIQEYIDKLSAEK